MIDSIGIQLMDLALFAPGLLNVMFQISSASYAIQKFDQSKEALYVILFYSIFTLQYFCTVHLFPVGQMNHLLWPGRLCILNDIPYPGIQQ